MFSSHKKIQKLFWAKDWRFLKIIHMDVDPGILLPHQMIDPLQKELPELPLDLVHHCSIDHWTWRVSGTLRWFLEVTVKNQLYMKSDTLWHIQCRVPPIARVTCRQTLLCSMTTSLMSMPGCYLFIAEEISQEWHNRTKCFDGYVTVNKCSRVLTTKKWIRRRQ